MSSVKPVEIIACSMMEHEVRAAMKDAGLDCPVVWIERELHNFPDRLRRELQAQLDRTEAETVLLAFAQCGNAAAGLEAREVRLGGSAARLLRAGDGTGHLTWSGGAGELYWIYGPVSDEELLRMAESVRMEP